MDNVRCPSWAHWKARILLVLGLIELFSLGVTAEALRANIGSKSAISLQRGPADQKFHIKGVAPTHHSSSQKTMLNDLSQGIKIWRDFSSVFTARHGMQTRSCDEISVRPSVCLSDKRVHCDKNERKICLDVYTIRKSIYPSF